MSKILIVEDNKNLADKLRDFLQFQKHVVDVAYDGEDGWQLLQAYKYDLLILDWEMPGMTGPQLCVKYRESGGMCSILMLTGNVTIDDKEIGLDSGADDYLCKPFDMRELSARINALSRRAAVIVPSKITIGNLTVDSVSHRVTRDGQQLHLQPKEFAILEFLMKNPNGIFNAKALLERLWNADSEVSEETIRGYIKTLRKKVTDEHDSCPIKTVHGLGYKIES
jgi:DNA-binding response OmpR family regulator